MLNKPKARLTNQRKMILNYLLNSKNHPTAEEVFLAVRMILPQISFGTVYRNLNVLVEDGLLNALDFEKGPTRYDANKDHSHLVCDKCKKIVDVKGIDTKKMNRKVHRELKANIHSSTLFFFGICSDCLENIKK